MKKSLGTMVAIMVVAILMGTFITAKSSTAGEKARDGHFIAYDNGTVLDTKTKLMWAAKDNGGNIYWQDAKSYCENYRGGGYTDWRMPTKYELSDLYDKAITGKYGHHLTNLITLTGCCIWASDKTFSDHYANFDFIKGRRSASSFNNSRALPVRSGK
jgi:hypothetical protein